MRRSRRSREGRGVVKKGRYRGDRWKNRRCIRGSTPLRNLLSPLVLPSIPGGRGEEEECSGCSETPSDGIESADRESRAGMEAPEWTEKIRVDGLALASNSVRRRVEKKRKCFTFRTIFTRICLQVRFHSSASFTFIDEM